MERAQATYCRPVSLQSLQTISRTVAIHQMLEERVHIFNETHLITEGIKKIAKEVNFKAWQEEWTNNECALYSDKKTDPDCEAIVHHQTQESGFFSNETFNWVWVLLGLKQKGL